MPVRGATPISGSSAETFPVYLEKNPDALFAFCPLEVEVIETTMGDNEATIVQILEVLPDGGFVDVGEHPIFWSYVRSQLYSQCDEEYRWLVGRPKKGRRAYRIEPPTPVEIEMADVSTAIWEAAKLLEAEVETDDE